MREPRNSGPPGGGLAMANERSFFPPLTGRENLDFFASLEDVPRSHRAAQVETVLASTELLDSTDMLVVKFSSGMHQRLGIARALLKRPRILLLEQFNCEQVWHNSTPGVCQATHVRTVGCFPVEHSFCPRSPRLQTPCHRWNLFERLLVNQKSRVRIRTRANNCAASSSEPR
jgi:hypothetical protein